MEIRVGRLEPPPERGLHVVPRGAEPVEHLLKRFGRKVDKSAVLHDLRAHRWHLTRSERRRLKARNASRRAQNRVVNLKEWRMGR